MKIMKYHLFILVVLCFSSQVKAQYIQLDDSYTAQQLVEDVLIDSDCATISNISVSGHNFGDGLSYGYFSAGTSTFPFAKGVILSTGKATSAIGPNNSILSEGPRSWVGDQDLEMALEIGQSSFNATVLEFDFEPLADKVSFDYIFSSEQYLTSPSPNQCNFTDGFVFLIKEANSSNPYKNLAVIPGTITPVLVNTVRGAGTICPPANPEYFGGFNGSEHPTNFNGQTVIMKASTEVIPGIKYHMKLVVADQGNNLYDSAIFFGGGSFKIETDLGSDKLLTDGNALCQNETLTLTATNPTAISYKWFKNGIPQVGANTDQFAISVNENASYSVEVGLGGTCFSTGEIKIEYAPTVVLSNTTLVQCDEDNDGLALFNLTQASPSVTAGNANLTTPVYFKSFPDANGNIDPITNFTAFQNTQSIVYARAENQYGCFGISEVTLAVSNNSVVNPPNLEKCDNDSNPTDGLAIFNLRDRESAILDNLPGGNVNYYTSYQNALLGLNAIPDPSDFENTDPFSQTIYAKLSSGADCYGIAQFEIIVNSFGTSLDDEEAVVCSNSTATTRLDAGSGFATYTWNTVPQQFTQFIDVNASGIYSVTVTNANGCEGTKTFNVKESSKAEITSVTVNDFNGQNNSFTVNLSANSIGDYQYSIDSVNFQDSPTFTNVKPGLYTVYVIDKNDCGPTAIYGFAVMDYPKFFSPNGDGINDFWNVPNLRIQPNATVSIFDRYGKLIYFFKANQQGWNGMHEGRQLPATDYWFRITLDSGREVRGHFSLIR